MTQKYSLETLRPGKPLILTLNILTILGFVLLTYRMFIVENMNYIFLAWNLLLAAVPLIVSYMAKTTKHMLITLFFIAIWQLFYPNAPYILTDFIHVGKAFTQSYIVFDSFLVAIFALNGLILGFLSLHVILNIVSTKFTKTFNTPFLITSSTLTAIRLYLGRVYRLNSWELVTKPDHIFSVFNDVISQLINKPIYLAVFFVVVIAHIVLFKCFQKVFKLA